MDLILIGTDPYLLDLACARVAGFDYKEVKTLRLAEQKGLLTPDHHRYVDGLDVKDIRKPFQPPKPGPIAAFIHSPKRQNFFLRIRNTPMFSYLCSTDWFGHLLFLTGLRQDVFRQEEVFCNKLTLRDQDCDRCHLCRDLCPLGLNLPEALENGDGRCIHCLYCYCACDKTAIEFHGELGFFSEQLRQYDERMRKLYSEREPM
jgi:ferredoxin